MKNARFLIFQCEGGEFRQLILPEFAASEGFFLQIRIGRFRRIANSDSLVRSV